MKKFNFILLALVGVFANKALAQTISPQVINSAGTSQTVTIGTVDYFITSNIGEPIITTENNGNNIVTQGFLQPFGSRMQMEALLIKPISCKGKTDAEIRLDTIKTPANSYLVYKWFYNGVNICPNSDCRSMDSLAAGTYSIVVYALNNTNNNKLDSVIISPYIISQNNTECDSILVYSAFSPNGDLLNDNWIIDNIENTENKVTIYNRWGGLINFFENYNNIDVVWKGTTKTGQEVANGTYFYVIKVKEQEPKKGWVEVMGR